MVKRLIFLLALPPFLIMLTPESQAFNGNTSGLHPRLVGILHRVAGRFKRQLTVTSGCHTSEQHQGKSGARNSFHMHCKVVHIKVQGIGKVQVARYVAGLAARDGIGTYCHDGSVHVDLGPRRKKYWEACFGQH
jgi:uncharacterized protein YcbK (DUF882 family)